MLEYYLRETQAAKGDDRNQEEREIERVTLFFKQWYNAEIFDRRTPTHDHVYVSGFSDPKSQPHTTVRKKNSHALSLS